MAAKGSQGGRVDLGKVLDYLGAESGVEDDLKDVYDGGSN